MQDLPDDLKSQSEDIIKDAKAEIKSHSRRRLLGNLLTLGGLSLATGVVLKDAGSVNELLRRVSRFNDEAQAAIFDPRDLAPTYDASMVAKPFRFNAFYPYQKLDEKLGPIDDDDFRLKLSGLIDQKTPWSLKDLRALPQLSQITRHICVEGWSLIGQWEGAHFGDFLKRIGADLTAKYIRFDCADGYHTSIDMPTALHAQTQMTLSMGGKTLPKPFGYPMKIRMPTKLGYKNPKHVIEISVTNVYPGGLWEDQGYNWFGGS